MDTFLKYNEAINQIDACAYHEICVLECVRKKVFYVKMWWGNWVWGEINNPYCSMRLKKENVIMSSYVTIKNTIQY